MNTKIVYSVISTVQDTYLEQTLCSVFSAKYYNPDVCIVLVIDVDTDKSLLEQKRSSILEFVDEKVVVNISSEFTKKEKSRWLKTNLRNLVKGDYLFIDSDTVVTGELSEVDQFSCSLGAVKDLHLDFKSHVYKNSVCKKANKSGWNIVGEDKYFNSGVVYVKDNPEAREFYSKWHCNWLESVKSGVDTDQQSFAQTNLEMNHIIEEISGVYNCQVRIGISYLHEAKIIHFFNSWGKTNMHVLFSSNFFKSLKNKGLTDDVKELVLNCKSEFNLPVILIDENEFTFKRSMIYLLLHYIYSNNNIVFRILNFSTILLVKPITSLGKLFNLKKK